MTVCMMVIYMNFIVEKSIKDTLIVTKAWNISQAKEGDSRKRGKCSSCLQRSMTYDVLNSVEKCSGFMIETFKLWVLIATRLDLTAASKFGSVELW